MPTSDPILDHTLACLQAHFHPEWGDRNPFDVFSRLIAKNVKPSGWTSNTHMNLLPDQIRSRQEEWGIAKLQQLKRGHSGVASAFTKLDGPIIVVEYGGVSRLLDGNHRINTWVANRDCELHSVHIHTIDGTSDFIELPTR